MVFICKHLRPCLLNLWTFLRQVMPLSGKNNKNSVVMFGDCEEEPTPSPSQGGRGVEMIALRIVFDVFAFWKLWHLLDVFCCWQEADGSSLTIRCLATAGEGASCQNFRKGLLLFLLKVIYSSNNSFLKKDIASFKGLRSLFITSKTTSASTSK